MQRTVVKPRDESRPWPGRPAADGLTAPRALPVPRFLVSSLKSLLKKANGDQEGL